MKKILLVLATFLSFSAGAQTISLLPGIGGFGGGFSSADNQLIQAGLVGPKMTTQWEQVASSQAPKLIQSTISIRLHDELVNELYLRADKNRVQVSDVVVTLSNGQTLHLVQASGTLRNGQTARVSLHDRFSLRVERIEMTITSPGLIGSRGQLTAHVGLVR